MNPIPFDKNQAGSFIINRHLYHRLLPNLNKSEKTKNKLCPNLSRVMYRYVTYILSFECFRI